MLWLQERPQVVPRRDEPDRQCQKRGAKQGRADNETDLNGVETDRGQVCRQDDDGEAIAKPSHATGDKEQGDVSARRPFPLTRHLTAKHDPLIDHRI